MSEDSPPPGSPRRKPWHLLGRAKLPITSTLLVAFGGLVAIAVTTVLMLSIRTARENTDQLQEETGLSDSGFARHRDDLAMPLGRGGKPTLEQCELFLPSRERSPLGGGARVVAQQAVDHPPTAAAFALAPFSAF